MRQAEFNQQTTSAVVGYFACSGAGWRMPE